MAGSEVTVSRRCRTAAVKQSTEMAMMSVGKGDISLKGWPVSIGISANRAFWRVVGR